MALRVFAGAEFRLIFEYVEKLRLEKVFCNLKGLLYFPDGHRAYPARPIECRPTFVFLAEDLYDASAVRLELSA